MTEGTIFIKDINLITINRIFHSYYIFIKTVIQGVDQTNTLLFEVALCDTGSFQNGNQLNVKSIYVFWKVAITTDMIRICAF